MDGRDAERWRSPQETTINSGQVYQLSGWPPGLLATSSNSASSSLFIPHPNGLRNWALEEEPSRGSRLAELVNQVNEYILLGRERDDNYMMWVQFFAGLENEPGLSWKR